MVFSVINVVVVYMKRIIRKSMKDSKFGWSDRKVIVLDMVLLRWFVLEVRIYCVYSGLVIIVELLINGCSGIGVKR